MQFSKLWRRLSEYMQMRHRVMRLQVWLYKIQWYGVFLTMTNLQIILNGRKLFYFQLRRLFKEFNLIVLLLFLGETSVWSTISLLDYTDDRGKRTTQLLPKNGSSGKSLAFHILPSTLLYILIVLVGVFIIICGVFVGIYSHKHCNTQSYSTKSRKVDQISNEREEYNSLELNVHEESIHSRDPTYLEPVSDAKPHYEEIISLNETTEQICQTISDKMEIQNVSMKLQSSYFPSAKRFQKPYIDTNSLYTDY